MKFPKSKKKKDVALGISSPQLATAIQETLGITCRSDDVTREVVRGIRMHFNKFIKELDGGMLEKAQLGLGHSYSRAKVGLLLLTGLFFLLGFRMLCLIFIVSDWAAQFLNDD